jgi:hypothetical protein
MTLTLLLAKPSECLVLYVLVRFFPRAELQRGTTQVPRVLLTKFDEMKALTIHGPWAFYERRTHELEARIQVGSEVTNFWVKSISCRLFSSCAQAGT